MRRFQYVIVIFAVFFASTALAQPDNPRMFEWPNQQISVAYLDGTDAIFFDTSGEPYRALGWDSTQGNQFDDHIVIDLDKDDSPEFVGAGRPSFVLRSNTDPWWSVGEGCDQVLIGDFAADKKYDVLCNDGSALQLYTHDGQTIWSLTLGRRVDKCRAGDYNGDLKADIECKWAGSDKIVRLDSSGEFIGKELKKHEIPKDAIELKDERSALDNLLASGKSFHFSTFSVKVDGKKLTLKPDSKEAEAKTESFDSPILSAHIFEFGKKGEKLIAVTDNDVGIINEKGNLEGTYSTSANRYRRSPVAKIKNVYANGFKNTSKVTKAVKSLKDRFAECYEDRVRADSLAGVGQLLFQMYIDKDGSIKRINTLHSDLGGDTIESCAKNALRKGNYPGSKTGQGSINLDLQFSFRDK